MTIETQAEFEATYNCKLTMTPLTANPLSDFERGILSAASVALSVYDSTAVAASIILKGRCENLDVSSLDEDKKVQLRRLAKESGINLTGL
jgi:hypothetical protein